MPRSQENTNEFIAGELPVITFKNKKYYVDGRLKVVRNVKDFSDELYVDEVWNRLSKEKRNIICFEFHGSKPYDQKPKTNIITN